MLQVCEQSSGLAGFLELNTDLFDAATIRRLGEQFETLLAAALDAPEGALAALQHLFAAQAERSAGAAALVWDGGTRRCSTPWSGTRWSGCASPSSPCSTSPRRRRSAGSIRGRCATW